MKCSWLAIHGSGLVSALSGGASAITTLLLLFAAHGAFAQIPGPATQPASAPASAPSSEQPPAPAPPEERFSFHGQGTVISMVHDAFHAPYSGPNSLPRHEDWKTSVTGTLFLGARLPWPGGEAYFNPEVAGGEGFGGVKGIAGFPNGEIPRVGSPEPQPYVARLYYRQDFGFGGEKEKVESQQNQIAGMRDISRFTLYLGKFSATDFFDNNAYSHDPRSQFQNWALMDNGAWDYPADTRGYTYGAVAELNAPNWTLRYGAFGVPKEANGGTIDSHIPEALGQAIEYEQRWTFREHPGAARVLAFVNGAHMGSYRRAIDNPTPTGPDITSVRTYSTKYGFGLSAEQAFTDDLAFFGRLGWNDGHTESWAFTEIDRTVSIGVSAKGTRWHRPDDVVGAAAVINGLSKDHRDYLEAGGIGFIIGDGKLSYGYEEVAEAYYLIKVSEHIFVTADAQYVENPAYNRDRGPVFVFGVRAHVEF